MKKSMLIILTFFALSIQAQTITLADLKLPDASALVDFKLRDASTHKNVMVYNGSFETFDGNNIEKVEIHDDKIYIYISYKEYEPGFGLGITCAVYGCTSDHQRLVKKRYIYQSINNSLQLQGIEEATKKMIPKEKVEYIETWVWENN